MGAELKSDWLRHGIDPLSAPIIWKNRMRLSPELFEASMFLNVKLHLWDPNMVRKDKYKAREGRVFPHFSVHVAEDVWNWEYVRDFIHILTREPCEVIGVACVRTKRSGAHCYRDFTRAHYFCTRRNTLDEFIRDFSCINHKSASSWIVSAAFRFFSKLLLRRTNK